MPNIPILHCYAERDNDRDSDINFKND